MGSNESQPVSQPSTSTNNNTLKSTPAAAAPAKSAQQNANFQQYMALYGSNNHTPTVNAQTSMLTQPGMGVSMPSMGPNMPSMPNMNMQSMTSMPAMNMQPSMNMPSMNGPMNMPSMSGPSMNMNMPPSLGMSSMPEQKQYNLESAGFNPLNMKPNVHPQIGRGMPSINLTNTLPSHLRPYNRYNDAEYEKMCKSVSGGGKRHKKPMTQTDDDDEMVGDLDKMHTSLDDGQDNNEPMSTLSPLDDEENKETEMENGLGPNHGEEEKEESSSVAEENGGNAESLSSIKFNNTDDNHYAGLTETSHSQSLFGNAVEASLYN
jgi:hypothetical protein